MRDNVLALIFAAAFLSACATNIHPTVASNPPPTRALSTFGMFEIKPLTVDDSVKEPDAVAKIREVCGSRLGDLIAGWNRGKGATLVIEPRIRELKFVSGANRVFAGAMAGSSAVRITAKLYDKSSGAVIAEPEFYQRASAWSGSFTYGAQDNDMLRRICTVAEDYLRRNYVQAVGGPTGSEPP